MEIKFTVRYHCTYESGLKIPTMPNVGEEVEQLSTHAFCQKCKMVTQFGSFLER
jgi:hypothetical protein